MNFYEAMRRAYKAGFDECDGATDCYEARINASFEAWFAANFGTTDSQQQLKIEHTIITLERNAAEFNAAYEAFKAKWGNK